MDKKKVFGIVGFLIGFGIMMLLFLTPGGW